MIHAQEASTASRRINSEASPAITSSSRRSYASGEGAPKTSPYLKCISTGCVCAFDPGVLEMIRSDSPSSGWIRRANTLGACGAAGLALKRICGMSRNWTAISLARFTIPFPVRK